MDRQNAEGGIATDSDVRNGNYTILDEGEDMNDSDWEDVSIPQFHSADSSPANQDRSLTIEFDGPSDYTKKKPSHRASARDKELAELVHKVHLLCLLARGRLVDNACDDPLIQASLLSLLPARLLKIGGVSKLTTGVLSPLVNWFNSNFHVRSLNRGKKSFPSCLAVALETREGTSEEIAALCVALFRALKFATRFVCMLDVASLKPEQAENYESSSKTSRRWEKEIFNNPTVMVTNSKDLSGSEAAVKPVSFNEKDAVLGTPSRNKRKSSAANQTGHIMYKDSLIAGKMDDKRLESSSFQLKASTVASPSKESQHSERKGDLEFEMQLAMALSATASVPCERSTSLDIGNMNNNGADTTSLKRMKKIRTVESLSSHGVSTAVGSSKVGSPLFWAEVFCSGENLAGKWVHVDAVNAIINGEEKVEDAAAACKTSLRYVVAFAGQGAKDVTRRYCMKWYKIAQKRISSIWWDAVLAPLRELESAATGDTVDLQKHHNDVSTKEHCVADSSSNQANSMQTPELDVAKNCGEVNKAEASGLDSFVTTRNILEDMELETRALTEPLPTNQQAYKSHELYALEKWLTRYQILHPRAPVLGFCSGHPVYPRSCVQTLKSKERWLREGLQVKANELPAKVGPYAELCFPKDRLVCPVDLGQSIVVFGRVLKGKMLKRSGKVQKVQVSGDDDGAGIDPEGVIELYGKWQLEPMCLPPAVNGIVPKNERGQVDVWSEKCLPPGTVHIRLPRAFHVAKRLEIDYAPAMVGFEFRQGRPTPVFEGIVVCTEFKDAILEAYAEEEERRQAEEKKRDEAGAITRWYQLLSSIITRQKLKKLYGEGTPSKVSGSEIHDRMTKKIKTPLESSDDNLQPVSMVQSSEEHEHVFVTEREFSDGSSLVIKRCDCGFSFQVEEL